MKTTLTTALLLLGLGWAVQGADVKENWEKHCAKCHASDGSGNTKMGKKLEAKDMRTEAYQKALTDENALKAIKDGLKQGDKTLMKPTEGLSAEEMKALVGFVRGLKK